MGSGVILFRQILYGALMWAVFVYAMRRGGWEERLAAAGIVVNAYLTAIVLYLAPAATRYRHVETSVVLVDLALLLLLLWISLRSTKFWPIWMTAMHALTVLSHFAPYVPHILPWGYWNAIAVWGYPMLIVLGFAVRRHSVQRADWLRFSGLS